MNTLNQLRTQKKETLSSKMSSFRVPGKVYGKKTVRFNIPDNTTTDDEIPFPQTAGDMEYDFSIDDVVVEELPGQHNPSFGWETQTPQQIEALWKEVLENGTQGIPIGYLFQLVESI